MIRLTITNTPRSFISRIPVVGHFLQAKLDPALPALQEHIHWAALAERQSNAAIVSGLILLCFAVFLRRMVCWYGRNFSMPPIGPWEQLSRAGVALFFAAPISKSE
jgi:hypothetical protein